jgi:type I restriction enzyme S subunit
MAKYKFSDIAYNITDKKMPAPEDKVTYIGLEHMDTGSLSINRYGSSVPLKGEKLVMRKGDILFGRRNAYLKRVAIAPHDGLFSAHGMILRPKIEVVNERFFPFFIASDYFMDTAIRISVGSLSPTVNWGTLKDVEFNLPDMKEQEKLAELLWAANDVKEAYKKLLSLTDNLVKSQFIEMFGDPVTNPMKWETPCLAELGVLNRGVSKNRPRNSPDLLGGPYPLVQTGEVTNCETYIDHYESTYSEKGLAQSKMWPKGTLCITIAANIAQTGILGFDACFPDSVVGFIAGNRTRQIFIHYWFSFFQKILDEQAPQVAQKNINLKTLSELKVIAPPMNLQDQFVSFAEQTDKSKFELQQTIVNLENIIKSLLLQYVY